MDPCPEYFCISSYRTKGKDLCLDFFVLLVRVLTPLTSRSWVSPVIPVRALRQRILSLFLCNSSGGIEAKYGVLNVL